MLMFFGASEQTFPYANSYLTYYVSGTVFAILTAGLGQFITCQGFANEAMLSTIIGAVMNIILDPIFIFLFNMGVRGSRHRDGHLAGLLLRVLCCGFCSATASMSRSASAAILPRSCAGYSPLVSAPLSSSRATAC